MEQTKLNEIVKSLSCINQSDWSRVKRIVDMKFSSKAAKMQLDDFNELKRDLEVEFNFRRFGEKWD